MSLKGNLLVAQSGGSTAVINASVAGVISEAQKHLDVIEHIYGGLEGIEGILQENMIDVTAMSQSDLARLRITPGAALFSCRLKLKTEHLEKVYEIFKVHNIRFFYYIGGNDSQDSANQISQFMLTKGYPISAIGVPKTIDNDLVIIDHCPGFGSVAKYLATSIRELSCDAAAFSRHNVVTLVEVMGRNAGWIAASTALAKRKGCPNDPPHIILLPEVPYIEGKFIEKVNAVLARERHCVVVISEGITNEKGDYISVMSEKLDSFGHPQIGNVVEIIKASLERHIKDVKVRDHRCAYLQRAAAHIASKTDVDEAFQVGVEAVKASMKGETGKMVTMVRDETKKEYTINYVLTPIEKVANEVKVVPKEMIAADHMGVNDDLMFAYVAPLAAGEVTLPYVDGVPDFFSFDVSKVIPKQLKK